MHPIDHAWALLKANSPEEIVQQAFEQEEENKRSREKVAEMLRAAEERKRIELLRMTADPERAAEAKRMLREMDPEGPQY